MIKESQIHWHTIEEYGMPPKDCWRIGEMDREFLIKGEYSICTGRIYDDGSGFSLPDDVMDTPIAWAIVEGH